MNSMNSENSETPNSNRLLLNLPDKINLKKSDTYVALYNASIYYTRENIKKTQTITTNLKYQLQHATKNFNHVTEHISCQTFRIIS